MAIGAIDQSFNAATFEEMSIDAIGAIHKAGKKVLLTGGTGLYLSALVNGLSKNIPTFPDIRMAIQQQLDNLGSDVLHDELSLIDCISAKRIHKNDTHRLIRALEIFKGTGKKWSSFIAEHQRKRKLRFPNILTIGLTRERAKLYQRIHDRSILMIENGFRQEVEGLLEMGFRENLQSMQAIGYSHMLKHIHGEWSKEEMIANLTRDTRRYAKRQYTWFKKISDLQWIESSDCNRVNMMIDDFLTNNKQPQTLPPIRT